MSKKIEAVICGECSPFYLGNEEGKAYYCYHNEVLCTENPATGNRTFVTQFTKEEFEYMRLRANEKHQRHLFGEVEL
ncbi:MAG: hypothetical protein AAF542_18135 [Pseudomonadota bacterium]